VQVGNLDWGEDGAAVVGGGDLRPPVEVSFQMIRESYPSSPSCARGEDVVQIAEVEAGCWNDKVLHFSGDEHCDMSGR
jgi:hypothetical protein